MGQKSYQPQTPTIHRTPNSVNAKFNNSMKNDKSPNDTNVVGWKDLQNDASSAEDGEIGGFDMADVVAEVVSCLVLSNPHVYRLRRSDLILGSQLEVG